VLQHGRGTLPSFICSLELSNLISDPSFAFVGFALVVVLLIAASKSLLWRRVVMLLASAVFLSSFSHDPLAFLPLASFLLVGYCVLRLTARYPARLGMIAIVATLTAFCWLKKYVFVPNSLWLSVPYVTVGLSYMLFRLLHLIIEARDEPSYARIPFHVFLTYLIGFNTLVAGPIQTFDEYTLQETSTHVSLADIGSGVERIVIGLFKTNVLATLLFAMRGSALVALEAQGVKAAHTSTAIAVFAIYPLFLYCNFAGYIDIVIGISQLFARRLPENFDRPFSATNFIDFWGRWHITLSKWFRTYVYNPLLMTLLRRYPSRGLEPALTTFVFFVTFFLVGVWHGQSAAFLFYGFLQGFGMSANKLYQIAMSRYLGKDAYARLSGLVFYRAVARGLTFTWFTFTLIWFWASWHEALNVLGALNPSGELSVWVAILLFASAILWVWEVARIWAQSLPWRGGPLLDFPRLRAAWSLTLLLVVIAGVALGGQSAPEVVYKNF
jgi:D-alanyl-lipoteichoic acid acyltransferase DltB (MBOAT superfamily)